MRSACHVPIASSIAAPKSTMSRFASDAWMILAIMMSSWLSMRVAVPRLRDCLSSGSPWR
jgi:hypothetical protein